jgi:hypothetical protein
VQVAWRGPTLRGRDVSRLKIQEAILRSEFLWFGGTLGPPKTYDAGTSHHTAPQLRTSDDRADGATSSDGPTERASPATPRRLVIFEETDAGWKVTFDGVE